MRLEGKVAIVTGASRGLGQHVAEGYAREGAFVVVAARSETVRDERLPGTIHETVARIHAAGGRALAVPCNVGDFADCERMAKRALDEFGRIDILVNNAAVQPPGRLSDMQVRHWDVELRVNLSGPFYCTRAVLESMRGAGGGSIINVSSVAADHASAGTAGHYGLMKLSLENMTRLLAAEVAPWGIAVNALKPKGAVDTPGLRFARAARGDTAPPGLPGPEEFVEAAIILATSTPGAFTGNAINDEDVLARFGHGTSLA